MARPQTLLWTAIAGTALLWVATIAAAVFEIGSIRLFMMLRAGAVLAALTTVAVAGIVHVKRQVDRIHGDLNDAVAQAADELHTAVGEAGHTLRQEAGRRS